MDDELGEFDLDGATDIAEFQPARFSSGLRLPAGSEQKLRDAAAAVRQEFRDSSRWKRLSCKKVSVFAEGDRGTVYVVHIGRTVEFDWTWEGAKAFCPNSLDDGHSFSDRFAVHLLSEQRRMHPDVCKVVSTFQYNGVLKTAAERAEQESTLSPFLADRSRTIWYVLDEEDCGLAAIRASRGPGNKSWVRQITKSVLQKLFSDADVRRANGLFISPFKAQANAVGEWLAGWGMDSWESATVHSQQGSEADIVVFDTVNAGSHTWGIVEWKRLVNVALSRARDAVVILASRAEMDEPCLRPLKRHMTPSVLTGHCSTCDRIPHLM